MPQVTRKKTLRSPIILQPALRNDLVHGK